MFTAETVLLILVLTGLPYLVISTWIGDTFPKFDAEHERILTRDDASGCSVVLFPERDEYYVFNDSCIETPKSKIYQTKSLRLRNTKILVIKPGDLDNWSSITSFAIEMNSDLLEIETGSFNKLINIKTLSINYNMNLRSINADLFDGLINIEEFNFIKNNFHHLSDIVLSLSRLPALKILNLSHNPLVAIKSGDFSPLNSSKIEILYLKLCGLIDVDEDAFAPLTHLRILDLETNSLTSDQLANISLNLSKNSKNLTYLSLSDNLLDRNTANLFQAIAQTNITDLILTDNRFNLLQKNLFPIMPNLKTLDISALKAIYLDNSTFNSYYLPNLTKLSAARNRFPGILKEFLLPNLIELDISENSCEDCSTPPIFKLAENQFKNMINLKRFNLAKNALYNFKKNAFTGLINLEILNLSNCTIYDLPDFPFINLLNLIELDLSYNKFLHGYSLTHLKFAGLKNLKILKLNNCDIKSINDANLFKDLVNLKYLTLRDNILSELNPYWLLPLINLAELDLAYNDMYDWQFRLFVNNTKLKVLSLYSNRIKHITVKMLEDFNGLQFLDVSENHLYCTCQTVSSVQYFIANYNKTIDSYSLNTTNAKCYRPKSLLRKKFALFIKDEIEGDRCVVTDKTSLIMFSILITIILLCIGLVGAYYLRYHIRYWIFLLRQAFRFNYFPGKKNKNTADSKYKYDAFVSYSHEDRSFVIRLVSMLETQPPYYKLCVFERDFSVGDIITESVLDCLSASRRTILVISDSFARSTWCLWEMQLAQHKRLFFKDESNEPLVIVKIGEIMDRHMTPTLRYLIKTRIYLQWNAEPKKQKIFWQKLRESLAPPKVNVLKENAIL